MKAHPTRFVRLANKEDLNRIAELWAIEMRYYHTLDPRFFTPTQQNIDSYRQEIEMTIEDLYVFVLLISNEIQGFATISQSADGIINYNDMPFCRIGDLVLNQKFGIGVRKKFVQEIMKWAKEKGYQRIDLYIHAKDKLARSNYKEIGFEESFLNISLNIE